LVTALQAAVGVDQVLTDSDLVAGACVDWSGRFSGPCLALVRPGSVDEVATVLRVCAQAGVPVVPQGGNTGLVGGSVPGSETPAVVISTRRLNWLEPVDTVAGQVTVGAGALLGEVQRHCARAGWVYGVDLAARDSATIGGTVATNAGGIHVVAYGMTRAQVAGIQAVLPDGSVIDHLAGLAKDNTGYDLPSLLCGSEGTLGVITAVRLRLHAPHARTTVAMVGVPDYATALAVMARARQAGPLLAAEAIDATGMDLAMRVTGLPWPLAARHSLVVLLEAVDGGDVSGLALDEDADAVVAIDAAERARLWEYRERQADAFATLGVLHKLDVAVPLAQLAACAEELKAELERRPEVTGFGIFGHLADGNLHVELAGPPPEDTRVDEAVLECVARYGGSISAEHGVGRAKAHYLHLCRSAAEIAAMRAIKQALDPRGIMNPGVLFGSERRD
jgi:FAD/FMN-containing dehydrogenase